MASPKLFFIVCALLLVQNQARAEPQVKSIFTKIIQVYVPIVEKIFDYVSGNIEEAVRQAGEDITFRPRTVEALDTAVDKALDLFNKGLDKIKERGDANTGKVIDCVEAAKARSKKITEEVIQILKNPPSDVIAKARAIIEEAKKETKIVVPKCFIPYINQAVQDASDTLDSVFTCAIS